MDFHTRGLNSGEVLPCTRKEVKAALGHLGVHFVSMAGFHRHFEVLKGHHPPIDSGETVVAEAHVSQQDEYGGGPYVCFYVMPEATYTKWARHDFVANYLPKIAEWIAEVQSRTETAPENHGDFLVAWSEKGHRTLVWQKGAA